MTAKFKVGQAVTVPSKFANGDRVPATVSMIFWDECFRGTGYAYTVIPADGHGRGWGKITESQIQRA